ncbi:MAG: flagellar basal-body MS-ring/collar protein FliF [Gemmatimonadota bacterium]|nr:flagellar basal-body MS-ring/collar protein FliF [Gemmatimonadota bacterium]
MLRQLNSNGRMVVLGLAAVLLVGAVFAARTASAPRFVPLQRGMALEESASVSAALGQGGIEFQLGGGGTEVLVAEEDAARARVLLAQEGVPAGSRPGLELFDRPAWGMTDFTEQVTYRRALEGELARTIGTLRGVQRAQVHLTLPAASPLRSQDRPAEAAVVVALKADAVLSAEQVRGIAQLVSSSVDQLSPDHVAVIDDSGRPLSGGGGDEVAAGLSSRQHEMQSGVERTLSEKVQGMLAAALGPEAVRVQVAADLNFDQVDRTIEAYDTAGQVLKSEQRSDPVSGNVDGAAGTSVVVNEYLNSRTVERIIGGVGTVTRLTVSAMVDTRALGSEDGLTDIDRDRYTSLIRDAIGFDEARGDRVTVVALPFRGVVAVPAADLVPPVVPPAGPGVLQLVSQLAFPVMSLLALIVAFVLGWKALAPGKGGAAAPQLASGESRAGAVGSGTSGTPLREQAQRESIAEPQSAARVLRGWLTDPA